MVVKNWRFVLVSLMIPVLVCPLILSVGTGRAYGAPDTLDLQLDAPAIIRWDISDIMPGDSGIETIDLRNAGDIPGYIYIWIDDIVDGEGSNPESETGDTAEPGELSTSISLDITNPGMSFGKLTGTGYMQPYALPVAMASFPGSSNQALLILDTAVNPGETLELQWQWELPSSTGNEVQGDTVSFTINYMLSSFYTEAESPAGQPPLPPAAPPPTTATTTATAAPPTTVVESPVPARIFVSEDGLCEIYIPEGLQAFTGAGEELRGILIDTPADTPPAPELYEYGSKVYRVLCSTAGGESEATGLQQEVRLTIYLDPESMPQDAEVFLFGYHPVYGWTKLDATGGLAEGQLTLMTAWVDYLNLVAVFCKIDASHVELIAPDTPAPDASATEEPSGFETIWVKAALGAAVAVTFAVIVMAVIGGIRRGRRAKPE